MDVYVGTLSLNRRFHIASSPYKTLSDRVQTKRHNTPSYGNVRFYVHTKKVTVTKDNDESEGLPHAEGCEGRFLVAMEDHANKGLKKKRTKIMHGTGCHVDSEFTFTRILTI